MHAHHVVELIGRPGLRWVEVPEPDPTAQLVVEVMAAYGCWQDVITADPSWTLLCSTHFQCPANCR